MSQDPILTILIEAKNKLHSAQDAAERVAYSDAMLALDRAVREAYKLGLREGHSDGYDDGYEYAVSVGKGTAGQ